LAGKLKCKKERVKSARHSLIHTYFRGGCREMITECRRLE
jgi:hypothetical protein